MNTLRREYRDWEKKLWFGVQKWKVVLIVAFSLVLWGGVFGLGFWAGRKAGLW